MREPQIVDQPYLFPHRCMGCGRDQVRMLDLMADVPTEGRLYICVDNCLAIGAQLAGYLPADAADKLTAVIAEQETRHEELQARYAELAGTKTLTVADAAELLAVAASPTWTEWRNPTEPA